MELALLSEEERARLSALEKMFEQPGWAVLIKDAEEQVAFLEKQLEFVDDIKDHRYIRGRLEAMRDLRDYEARTFAGFEALITSRQEEEFEVDDSFGANE